MLADYSRPSFGCIELVVVSTHKRKIMIVQIGSLQPKKFGLKKKQNMIETPVTTYSSSTFVSPLAWQPCFLFSSLSCAHNFPSESHDRLNPVPRNFTIETFHKTRII